MIAWVIAAPLLAAILAAGLRTFESRRVARFTLAIAAALLPIAVAGKIDALSLVFAALVSALGLLATVFSTGSFSSDWGNDDVAWSRKSVYFILLGAFWSAMLLTVLADGFSGLWLGISATTLTTAFLVGFSGEAAALEAAWKYLVLCSAGIAFALLGIVILAHVSIALGVDAAHALSWSAIATHATGEPPLARLAAALMLIGFATKAGLVPMHAWLPDAHSKAPAPISALLSGVLVSCALYAIMRTLQVGTALGAGPLLHELLLWLGALSTIVAGTLMLTQTDLKRFLAYSTVEHAGIVALALGFGGPLGLLAALFHVTAHAFAKSAAFFAAGIVQREHGTTKLGDLHALWASGRSGRVLLGALPALSGMPPFGIFAGELLLVLAGVAAHAWIPLAVGLLGIALAFAAIARAAIEIEAGHAKATTSRKHSPASRLASAAAAAALAGALILGGVLWSPLGAMLGATAATIGGQR